MEPTPADAIDLQVKSSAISLALVQGFTNQVTNVTGTLEADVHVTGSGQDPHAQGFVDIKNGAFGIPAAGETFTGLTTRDRADSLKPYRSGTSSCSIVTARSSASPASSRSTPANWAT